MARLLSHCICAILLGGALIGCSSLEFEYEFGPGAAAGFGANYGCGAPITRSANSLLRDPAFKQFLERTIENELAVKGYRRGDPPNDFVVTSRVESAMVVAGRDPQAPRTEEVELSLTMIDSQTSELIWRGSVMTEMRPAQPRSERRVRLVRAVRELLDYFPSR